MRACAKVVFPALILIAFSCCLPSIRGSSGYVDVTVSEAKNMIESNPLLVVLDVRTQSEYNSGHIKNAKLIPHTELEARIGELDENRETLVYCHSGGRSTTASQILIDHDFSQVYNMLGGMLAWTDADYPAYVHFASIQKAIDDASEEDSIFVSSGTYFEHLVVNKPLTLIGENRGTTIIDGGGTGNVVLVKMVNNTAISGFTIQGSGCGCAARSGIHVQNSHNTSITGNIITDNGYGIQLKDSNVCTISGNVVANNEWPGIALDRSHRNIVAGNDIRENRRGIRLSSSSDNMFYHNNLVDNIPQVDIIDGSSNTWDDGYSSGGNYWSDYAGADSNGDGIGDTPYTIDENNQDNYPLMNSYISPKEMRGLYYELLENYNSLLADYQSLNTTYYQLLDDYAVLISNQSQLQSDYNLLNSTFHSLQLDYTGLQADYISLQNSYDDLHSNFNSLNTTYNELRLKQEATTNELNNIRNLMYTFIATTAILIATTVYFVRRKLKS